MSIKKANITTNTILDSSIWWLVMKIIVILWLIVSVRFLFLNLLSLRKKNTLITMHACLNK